MLRKTLTLFMLIAGFFGIANAQQRPQYTQYTTNNYLLNPAISGIERYIDVKVGQRQQWTGFNNSPTTSYVSIQMPIGMPADIYGNNTMNRSYVEDYKAPDPHHGIGMYAVIDDPGGAFTSQDINVTYAYHLGMSSRMTLSVGVAAGISRSVLDPSKITLANPADPGITSGGKIEPDLGLGAWLYGPSYFVGASVQGLLGRPLTFSGSSNPNQGKQAAHIFITSGYKLFLTDDIAVMPSFMLKYVKPAPVTVDLNTRLAFKDKLWIGGSYRKDDSFAAMAGFNLGSMFSFSYSYDFTTSQIKSYSSGSHEFVLGIRLNNKFKVTCPQENW